ncbi:uncharacterized protein [Panulirus ornatus]|uniref:uncharacterized protein n=1 Tax=Panulirus ornatus TaxID=150431 RepID=UPI003A8AA700
MDDCNFLVEDGYTMSSENSEQCYSTCEVLEYRYCTSSEESEVWYSKPSTGSEPQCSTSSKDLERGEDQEQQLFWESEVRYSRYGDDSHVQSGKSGDSEVVYNKPSEESFKWYNKPSDDAEDWYNFCYNNRYNICYDDSDRWYRKSSDGLGVRPKLGLKIQGSRVSCTCFDDVDWYKIYKMCKVKDLKMCKVKDLKMCKVKDLKKEKKYLEFMVHMGPHPILYNWIESEIGNVSSFLNDFRRLGRLPSPRCKDGPNSELEESQQRCTVHSGNVPQSPKDYVIVKLNEVLGKEATVLTLNAVAFTPPVTVLRTNTIKGNRKLLWRDLESHDVSCWMPQWSAVIIYQSIHFEDCFVAEMISQGRCIILYERQWQKIEVEPWCWDKNIYSAEKENLAQNTDNRKVAEGDATTNNVGELTLYYSAQGSISTLIVMALAPKEGEDVLELCAASSGKTSHIGAIMMNTGTLIANALQDDDVNAIEENNRLLGVNNCIVMSASPAAVARVIYLLTATSEIYLNL